MEVFACPYPTRDFPFGFMLMVSGAVICDFPSWQGLDKPIPVRKFAFLVALVSSNKIFAPH